MNEATFLAAVLFEKGMLTKKEAVDLQKMASTETFSSDLQDMIMKVRRALGKGPGKRDYKIDEIDAVDLLKNK